MNLIKIQAEKISNLIFARKYSDAANLWKIYTAGKTSREIVQLRDSIEEIELKLSAGFEVVKNSNTGDL